MATYKYENLKITVGGVEITGFADGDVIQEHIIDRTFKLPPKNFLEKRIHERELTPQDVRRVKIPDYIPEDMTITINLTQEDLDKLYENQHKTDNEPGPDDRE